jgi:hypothetical protein
VYIQMAKQLPGDSGVFGGNQIYLPKHPSRPEGNILQIANGCTDYVKRAHALATDPRFKPGGVLR